MEIVGKTNDPEPLNTGDGTMMTQIRVKRATVEQKENYCGVYPLYGFVTHEDGSDCPLEDLRGDWSSPDPVWEVLAPVSCSFDGELHSMLCHSLQDARDRVAGTILENCNTCKTCGCN